MRSVSLRSFLSLLAMFALLIAPLRMFGGGEAMAIPHHAPAASAGEHCPPAQDEPDESQPSAAIDCMIACAAMTGAGPAPGAAAPGPAPSYAVFRPLFFAGTAPGSDPPPPRRA